MSGVHDIKQQNNHSFRLAQSIAGEEHIMGGHVEGVIFGIGNPLLDIIAEVDQAFLEKHNLKPDDCMILSEHPSQLLEDIQKQFKVTYLPGGATQNSMRVAQWLIGVPNAATFLGCINEDEIGNTLVEKAKEDQINGCFVYDQTEPSGKCIVCLNNNKRTYVTHLGAARHLSSNHIDHPDIWNFAAKAKFFYYSGFPLINCPEILLKVSRYAVDNDKMVTFNLSSPSICKDFLPQLLKLLPFIDVVFGNQEEAIAFAESRGIKSKDPKEIALYIARFPKENGKRGRRVVLTNGENPIIVVQDGLITEHSTIKLDKEKIVDLNGSGDAFVGGFLAQLVQGGSIEDCIRSANYASSFIIQQSGCQLPIKPNFSHEATSF